MHCTPLLMNGLLLVRDWASPLQFLLLSNAKIILCRVLCIILTNNSLLIPRRLYNYHYLLCTLRVSFSFHPRLNCPVSQRKGVLFNTLTQLIKYYTTASLKTKISQTKFNFLIINLSTHQILPPTSHLLSHVRRITSDR